MPSSSNRQPDDGFSLPNADVEVYSGGRTNYNVKIPVEVGQTGYFDYSLTPIGGVVNQSGPFTFTLTGVNRLVDLNNACLYVKARILKENGDEIRSHEDVVAPINLLGQTMWESVNVTLNGHQITGAMNNQAGYKAYLETLLMYDQDSSQTHLVTNNYSLDSPGKEQHFRISEPQYREMIMRTWARGDKLRRPEVGAQFQKEQADDIPQGEDPIPTLHWDDPVWYLSVTQEYIAKEIVRLQAIQPETRQTREHLKELARGEIYHRAYVQLKQEATEHHGVTFCDPSEVNKGFYQRYHTAANSDPFDMYCNIPHDLFNVNNLLGSFNKVEVTLNRYPDRFILNTEQVDKRYKLHIMDLQLHLHSVEKIQNMQMVTNKHQSYILNETQLKKHVVPAGSDQAVVNVVSSGGIQPKQLQFFMVATRGADGAYNVNPFELYHNRLKKFTLKLGQEEFPTGGLTFNFPDNGYENPLVARGYKWLFQNTGRVDKEKGNLISFNAFCHGSFVVAVDLCPDRCFGKHIHNGVVGPITAEFEFETPLMAPIYIMHVGTYTKKMDIDQSKSTLRISDICTSMVHESSNEVM